MEQQKTLWVIFSVALFILVIVGVGVIWFLPSGHGRTAQTTAPAQPGGQAKISFDPYEWAKSANNDYPGLDQTQKSPSTSGSNFTIIYGQSQNPPAAGTQAQPAPGAAPAVPAAPSISTTVPSTGAPAAVAVTPKAPPAQAPRVAVRRPAPAPTRLVRVTEHWIQVASYTSDFRAEQARKDLTDKGISSRIISHEIGKQTFFRVRIGPYATQQEAEKFLTQVKKIEGFQGSYISLAYTTRSEN